MNWAQYKANGTVSTTYPLAPHREAALKGGTFRGTSSLMRSRTTESGMDSETATKKLFSGDQVPVRIDRIAITTLTTPVFCTRFSGRIYITDRQQAIRTERFGAELEKLGAMARRLKATLENCYVKVKRYTVPVAAEEKNKPEFRKRTRRPRKVQRSKIAGR